MIKIAVVPYNIIQGAAVLSAAPWVGIAPPTLTTYYSADPDGVAVSAPFVDVGGTTGGITVEIDETLSHIAVDQILDPVGARTTARTIQVTTTLMETQLENLQLALNGVTGSTLTGSGQSDDTDGSDTFKQLDLVTTTSATQPVYLSLIIDGWGPTKSDGTAAKRRFIVPKVLSAPKISQKFSMADQATVDVTFTAFYTGDLTNPSPITIIDSVVATGSGS